MKPYTKAELSAMRARWAQSWAEGQAAPADTITPEELHRRAVEELGRHKAWGLRMAAHHRAKAAEARAGGAGEIARTLGLLAANLEAGAALAEAEIRDRATKRAKAQRATKNRELAQRSRPGRRPALLEVLLATLRPLKREGEPFRLLLRRWRMERIGTLRLEDIGGGRFRVTDEDGDETASADYSRGTLEKLYSKAR